MYIDIGWIIVDMKIRRFCLSNLHTKNRFTVIDDTNKKAKVISELNLDMSNKIHRKDFDRICRLCLKYAPDESTLFPLFINEAKIPGFYGRFLKEFNESIPEVISTCLGIEVRDCNRIAVTECSVCVNLFVHWIADQSNGKATNENLLELRKAIDCIESLPTNLLTIKRISATIQTEWRWKHGIWYRGRYAARFGGRIFFHFWHFPNRKLNVVSQKYPEVVIVDRIKEEEFKQENTDSSCDESEWDNTDDVSYDTELSVGHEAVIDQEMVPHTNSRNNTYAAKRSTTVPLVTPSTPITSNDNEAQEWRPKRPAKYTYAKKPKVCTVCGELVEIFPTSNRYWRSIQSSI